MMSRWVKPLRYCFSLLAAAMLMAVPALALNPETGDRAGQSMGIVVVLLIISALAIVGYFVFIMVKKKKK